MNSNIKKELIEEINQLTIKQECSPNMPSRVNRAVLEIPSAHKVDVHGEGIEVSDANNVHIDAFAHGPAKHYSTQTVYSRNKVTLYDVRRKGLNEEGHEMELARYDLIFTFTDADEFVNFVTDLKRAGYTKRPN